MSEDFKEEFKDMKMAQFQKSAKTLGFNMAVMFYMIDALKFFEDMDKEGIKLVAFEIAWLGTNGIDPAKEGQPYHIKSIPNKTFSGYHLLAYYYVSWKLAIPEHLADIKLPYDKEFAAAELLK